MYAEDPKRFFPSPGRLDVFVPPSDVDVRVECGYAQGQEVTPHYDPLLAKVIVHAATRSEAIERLMKALRAFRIEGVKNNIPALLEILDSQKFRAGDVHTGLLADVMKQPVRA